MNGLGIFQRKLRPDELEQALVQEQDSPIIVPEEIQQPSLMEQEQLEVPKEEIAPIREPATVPVVESKPKELTLMEQLKALKSESDQEIKSARTMDEYSALVNAMAPYLQGFSRAKSIKASKSLGGDPGMVQAPGLPISRAKDLMGDRKSKIEELLTQQKIAALEQPKTMSKLDAAKIRESEAKAKMYESRSGQSIDQKELIKEETKIRSENRQEKKQLERDAQNTEKLLKDLEDTKKLFESYSKGSVGGTGPLATGFGSKKVFSADLERLDSKFKQQNLETMSKMFQGMSKAVDSDAERRAFESAQPAITNDDSTNQQIIEDRIKAAKELLNKQRAKASSIDSKGNAIEQDNQVDPTIEQYAKQNNINYKKAEQILKSRGYNAK
jgi:hypothetical protein